MYPAGQQYVIQHQSGIAVPQSAMTVQGGGVLQTGYMQPTGGSGVVPAQGIVYVSQQGSGFPRYKQKRGMALATLQITAGLMCIIINIVAIALSASISFISHGIWGGILFIITGSLGIPAAKRKTKCFIVSFMVMSIISGVAAALSLSFAAGGLSMDVDRSNYGYYNHDYQKYIRYYSGRNYDAIFAMQSVLLITSLLELIVSITSSAYCCAAVCCGSRAHSSMPQVRYTNQMAPQVIVIPAGMVQAGVPYTVQQAPNVSSTGYQLVGQNPVAVPNASQQSYGQMQPMTNECPQAVALPPMYSEVETDTTKKPM